MNYVIGHWPDTKNKQWDNTQNNPFLALKAQLAGKLTDEFIVNDWISASIKTILSKMGIQKVPVLKNWLEYIIVEIDWSERKISTKDEKINKNGDVFIKRWNRWYEIMRSLEITNAMNLAKTIEKRQNIVSKAWEVTRWSWPQDNKMLFNNLLRDKYIQSNKDTFYNTIIQWEELIWKVSSIKSTIRKPGYSLITVQFNDNCFGKVRIDDEDVLYYSDEAKDTKHKVWDYCFVRLMRKSEEEKDWKIIKKVDLKFTDIDIKDWFRSL